jgi:hypothetical protein
MTLYFARYPDEAPGAGITHQTNDPAEAAQKRREITFRGKRSSLPRNPADLRPREVCVRPNDGSGPLQCFTVTICLAPVYCIRPYLPRKDRP